MVNLALRESLTEAPLNAATNSSLTSNGTSEVEFASSAATLERASS